LHGAVSESISLGVNLATRPSGVETPEGFTACGTAKAVP
jgi:hypothetical protein